MLPQLILVADVLCQFDTIPDADRHALEELLASYERRLEHRRQLGKELLEEAGTGTELSIENPPFLYSESEIANEFPIHKNTVKYHVELGHLKPACVTRRPPADSEFYAPELRPLFTPEEVERWMRTYQIGSKSNSGPRKKGAPGPSVGSQEA